MGFGDFKDKFSYLFKVTSFIFRPYLNLKYNPKKATSIEDYLLRALVYTSTWVFVSVVYIIFVYLFIFQNDQNATGSFGDFFTRPPLDVVKDVFSAFRVSPFFNLSFLILLYFAITFHAEKVFLEGRELHYRLSGLIKTLTLGKFDISSRIEELDQHQVQLGRSNIHKTVSDGSKELLSIISASGWDLFGNPTPDSMPIDTQTKVTWWSRFKKFSNGKTLTEGYLLDVVSQRFRKVQIILLDPKCAAVVDRANAYLCDGAHKPIKDVQGYQNAINTVIDNLKIAYKKNKNIELKLVQNLPQWKMVIVEGEAWVQPIIQGIRSDHSPLYGFNKTDYSMYHIFWHLSESAWHDPNSTAVDLSK